jgi:hypothetical protein
VAAGPTSRHNASSPDYWPFRAPVRQIIRLSPREFDRSMRFVHSYIMMQDSRPLFLLISRLRRLHPRLVVRGLPLGAYVSTSLNLFLGQGRTSLPTFYVFALFTWIIGHASHLPDASRERVLSRPLKCVQLQMNRSPADQSQVVSNHIFTSPTSTPWTFPASKDLSSHTRSCLSPFCPALNRSAPQQPPDANPKVEQLSLGQQPTFSFQNT